ncbi:MAG: hypothetical protein ABR599_09365 [Gemmatimonadota bacterium]
MTPVNAWERPPAGDAAVAHPRAKTNRPPEGGAASRSSSPGEELRRREGRALDRRALELIARGWHDPAREEEVDDLAVALFHHQRRHNAPAAAWWRSAGVDPRRVRGWADVPPLPVAAWKRGRVAAFPRRGGRDEPTFLSSGTSGSRSRVYVEDLRVYEAAVVPPFRRHALPDRPRMRLLSLAPSPEDAPRSSLSHMLGVLHRALGAAGSAFLAGPDGVRLGELGRALEASCAEAEPVFLLGPAFAFVHALEGLEQRSRAFVLPPGSRLFQTGGFKGRSRSVEPGALLAGFARRLGISATRVVHEYGMAELASQFYSREDGAYLAPPWVRWRVLDPLTLEPAGGDAPGVLAVWDLANRSGCVALRTEDLARARGDGFELLGRVPDAEPRGCSLEADREERC